MATIQKPERRKMIWFVAMGVAGLSIVLMGLSVASASREARAAEARLRRARRQFHTAILRRFQLDSVQRQLTLLARRFGNEADFPSILHFLTTTARACGLHIKSLKRCHQQPPPAKTSKQAPATVLVRVPVVIEVTGRFHQIADFLGDATNAHFIFQIKKLDMTSDPDHHPNVVASIYGDVVFIKETE